jgi:zinc transport system ATP-binding protein
MNNNPIIEIKNLNFSYKSESVLEDVNFELYPEDFLALIGPNGGGKTTFVKLILGLLKPDNGTLLIFGKRPESVRSKIGYVPQKSTEKYRDFPINVNEVVQTGLLTGSFSKKSLFAARGSVQKVLESVSMDSFMNTQIGELSGGQLQRVLIARALVSNPELLIMDEPTASIDAEMEYGLYDILKELNKKIPLIIVTHDLTAISDNVNKIGCLNKRLYCHKAGEVTEEDILKTYNCPVEFLGHGLPHMVLKKH